MGIPGFFITMSKNFNISITKQLLYLDIFIDFNSLIYKANVIITNILFNYIKSKLNLEYDTKVDFDKIKHKSVLDRVCLNFKDNISESDANQIIEIRDNMIFETILDLVKNIYSQLSSINSINIYLDGVPFIGKMIEQRKRALLSGLIIRGKELLVKNLKVEPLTKFLHVTIEPLLSLDKTLIKPGTSFMIKLDLWLKNDFKTEIIKHSGIDANKWIYSGFDIHGEAEHKIMDEIINKSYKNIIVYSPDADLLVLLLPLTDNREIYVERDDNKICSINKLKDDIIEYIIKLKSQSSNIEDIINKNKSRLVYDISFIYNIFGNDFLPRLENINIFDKTTINRMFKQYMKYLEQINQENKTDNIFIINSDNNLNWYNYTQFLFILNKEFTNPNPEKLYKQNNNLLKRDKFADQLFSLNNFNKGFYSKKEDKYIWTKDFYLNSQFFDDSLDEIIKDYFIGIIMIDLLYSKIYQGSLSVEEKQIVQLWYYPHHKAPLIIDLNNYLNKYITNKEFNTDKFKRDIREHLIKFLKDFKIKELTPTKQLYYITPNYEIFIKLTSADKKLYPKLKEHEIYEEFINQLVWDENTKTLNIVDLIDCNGQRYIDRCVPLLKSKLDDKYINLMFDIKKFL